MSTLSQLTDNIRVTDTATNSLQSMLWLHQLDVYTISLTTVRNVGSITGNKCTKSDSASTQLLTQLCGYVFDLQGSLVCLTLGRTVLLNSSLAHCTNKFPGDKESPLCRVCLHCMAFHLATLAFCSC